MEIETQKVLALIKYAELVKREEYEQAQVEAIVEMLYDNLLSIGLYEGKVMIVTRKNCFDEY